MDRVFSLFPRLAERKNQKAGTLSGGEQQMCAIGRALMARPKLLMLDEPSMGLAPIFVEKIFEIIREINEQGTPILLVEQNALMALDAANRGYVMETGNIALADDAKALARERAGPEDLPRRRLATRSYRGRDGNWPGVQPAPTRSGKYGGESRKPIRGGRSARPWAIASAGPMPCVGTKPSCRAACASRQPATSTAPSRPIAGWQADHSANGRSGWHERPAR